MRPPSRLAGNQVRGEWYPLLVHQVEPPADIRLTAEDGDYGIPAWFPFGDRVLVTEALSQVGRHRLIRAIA
jgi:hypothetical protein